MSENLNTIMNEMKGLEWGIQEDTIELLKCFPFEKNGIGLGYKANEMIIMLCKIYHETKKEVSGLFELNEAYVMIQSFNGFLYTPELSDRMTLLSNIEDALCYEDLDKLYSVDKDKLMKKLQKLTQAQCFTVIRMVFEVWYSRRNQSLDINFEKLVKGIFGIN